MKILFNCINNVTGGGVQNSINFIFFAVKDKERDFLFLVSAAVKDGLEKFGVVDERVILIGNRRNILRTQKVIRQIENKFQPDIVYTMAGPSFVKFKSKHVLGISNPYITHAKIYHFFFGKSFVGGLKKILVESLKGLWGRLSANSYIFQTRTSLLGFCRRFFCSSKKAYVVPNAIGQQFDNKSVEYKKWSPLASEKILLCPSAFYPHKNLEIIFEVSELLQRNNVDNIKFVLTIESSVFGKLIEKWPGVNHLVSNIGPYSYSSALDLYGSADAIILPSLLETFSTTYIESVAMGLPLFVPQENFAVDICEDYGIYYKSNSVDSLYLALVSSESNTNKEKKQCAKEQILERYGNQEQRYHNIICLLESFNRH